MISSVRGPAGLLQLQRGCARSSARRGARPLQSKGACAISSAQGAAGSLQSNQMGARHRLRGGLLDCCNYRGGARDRREPNKSWQQTGIGLAPVAVARCCSTRFLYLPVGFRVPGLTLFFAFCDL